MSRMISFIHIPKTAGGTVIQTIKKALPLDQCVRLTPNFPLLDRKIQFRTERKQLIKHFVKVGLKKSRLYSLLFDGRPHVRYGLLQYNQYQLSSEQVGNVRFVSGHLKPGDEIGFLHRSPLRVSIMREPISRYFSWYYHQKRSEESIFYGLTNSLSPLEVYRSLKEDGHIEASNPQSRYIAHRLDDFDRLYEDALDAFDLLYTTQRLQEFSDILLGYLGVDRQLVTNTNKNTMEEGGYERHPDFHDLSCLIAVDCRLDTLLYEKLGERPIRRVF